MLHEMFTCITQYKSINTTQYCHHIWKLCHYLLDWNYVGCHRQCICL